jgi:hypothetical protein
MTRMILALSWGHQYPKPGLSNEIMAKEIAKIKNDYHWLLAQIEIAQALEEIKIKPDLTIGKPGIYINTFEVFKGMKEWSEEKKFNLNEVELRVMCHASHWRGCQMVLKRLGLSAKRIPASIPYDKDSHQWYTRGPASAFFSKMIHGLGYLVRGEIRIKDFFQKEE